MSRIQRAIPLAALLALGCTAEPEPESQSIVLTEMLFARADDGVSEGFDLDGLTTEQGDEAGCGQGDFVAPDGQTGIDNATARLVILLDQTEALALEPIIQQEINNGGMLLILELIGLDDPQDDDSVELVVHRGDDVPLVGTDERLEGGQTLGLAADDEAARIPDAWVEDGVLHASGLRVRVPVEVFDFATDFIIDDATIRLNLEDEGPHHGVVGGSLDWGSLMGEIANSGIDDGLSDSLPGIFDALSDLRDERGECSLLSATMRFQAVPVFLFEE